MDDFVKKAFEQAMRRCKVDEVHDLYTLTYPISLEIFVKNVGDKMAKEFFEKVVKVYGEELAFMTFIFFTAGYEMRCQQDTLLQKK